MPYRDHETRLRNLRELCAQADQLRAAADDLCRSLQQQLARMNMDTAPGPSVKSRRQKARGGRSRRKR